jgi:hypothetical protein
LRNAALVEAELFHSEGRTERERGGGRDRQTETEREQTNIAVLQKAPEDYNASKTGFRTSQSAQIQCALWSSKSIG